MDARTSALVARMDRGEFLREQFDGWDGRSNVRCPFGDRHSRGEDRNPSMSLYEATGGAHCFACGYHAANPAKLYGDVKGISEEAACRILWARHVEPLVPDSVWRDAAAKLLSNPKILNDLQRIRGLTKSTAIKYYLGYDGQRLTIPIFNKEGYCVNVRRYDLFKTGGPKMVSWKHGYGSARLYPLASLEARRVFVCEGELDALISCQSGVAAVTPAGGALTWRDEWSKELCGKTVFVVPDADEAGLEGARKRLESLKRTGISCAIVNLPKMKDGKDLTDWFLKYGGTKEKLLGLAPSLIPAQAAMTITTESSTGSLKTEIQSNSGLIELDKASGEAKLVERARAVFGHLQAHGTFFRNADGELYYVETDKDPVRVTDSAGPFMAMLTRLSPVINQATLTGRFIYKYLQNATYAHSEQARTAVWSLYDQGALYVHAGGGDILRLGEKFEKVKNATNEWHVLLDLPVKAMAVPEIPTTMPAEGIKCLLNLFLSNLPMCEEDRYFLLCWLMGILLRDFIRPKPTIRLLASTASGKSTVSKLISILIYGEELLSHSASTLAATYELSNRYPLLLLDNLETANMSPEIVDFLLIAATGGMRVKRQVSTDRGVVMDRVSSLVMTNGIEPFSRHELIDRTVELELDIKEWGRLGFHESAVFDGLRRHRGKIVSALLFVLARYVLPRIRAGELGKVIRSFPAHGKERFNEYLAFMALTLDGLWGYMPLEAYRRPQDLVSYWLDSQTRALTAQDVGTDDVLYFLNTLYDKHALVMGSQLRFLENNGEVILKCTTRELLTDFRVLAKFLGTKCPWTTERQLGTRLVDSERTLRKGGWTREKRRMHGRDEYMYTKKK